MNAHGDARDDDGLSLVELIFYVVILGLITTGIAVVFFNTWKAQAGVSDQVDATERGQLVSSQIEKAMRSAVAYKITDPTLTASGSTGSTLVVATAMTGSNACMAFSLGGGTAQLATTSGGAVSPAPWPTWQTGITAHKTSAGTSVPFFALVGTDVSYSFDVTTAHGPAVHFEGTAYLRNPTWGIRPGGGSQTCF